MNDRGNRAARDCATVSFTAKRLLMPLVSAFLCLVLPPISVLAQDNCVLYSDYNSALYLRFPESNFISGGFLVYGDDACQGQALPGLDTGPLGYVRSPSQTGAATICAAVHDREMTAFRDFTKYSSQEIWWCMDPNAPPTGSRESSPAPDGPDGSADSESRARNDADTGAASTHTCQTLVQTTNLKMTATYGLASGIQCRQIGAAGIFDSTIKRQAVQDAVDIFGYAEQGYQLCFPHEGRILFLDAATAPRSVIEVDYSRSGGFTCASLDRAGTVVLIAASPTVAATVSQAPGLARQTKAQYIRPGSYDSLTSAIPLLRCTVTPSTTLKLRAAPWGKWLGRVWEGSSITATARTRSWFKISHYGRSGWIAAWLTVAEGDCFGAGPGHSALPLVSLAGSYAALFTGA